MRKALLTSIFFTVLLVTASAADKYIKREVRGVWLATVYNIDWPTQVGTTLAIRRAQQNEMIKYLDELQAAGLNAVYFQARPMADAFYKSSYEPTSSFLFGQRGYRLLWDPLAFVVDECHKRGMECHAWVNPYRWKKKTDADWTTTQDKKLIEDNMLISYNGEVIFNPALPATRERLVNVCREMIDNYDIDGIIFDDYFYPSGMPTTSEAEDYDDWVNSGTTLSFGDWRRKNVNTMVADVYNMIQEVNPAIKFGISPAGAACSDPNVAASHGVDPIPKGSDWQYNGIFSDPVAWLEEGTIDYISPQIYWKMDHSTNPFGPMTEWWSKVAKKFGRHHYASHSLTFLQSSNTTDDWKEVGTQLQSSRTYTKNSAPGAIFYSACDIDGKKVTGLGNWLKTNKYQHPALTPAINWKEHEELGTVAELKSDGEALQWEGVDSMRYTIYAIPSEKSSTDVETSTAGGILADYLLGVSYTSSYQIPEEYQEGYQFAVCILDRYGNEFAPVYIDIADVIEDIAEDAVQIDMNGWTLTTSRPVSQLLVFNVMGQLMLRGTDTDNIDLDGLSTGIYVVKAITGKQTTVKKIYVR
ncbi:MAG: family 10 glycosylhydrolase [Bacteroidaceae bacterium]